MAGRFLLLSIRGEERAAEDEYESFARHSGLGPALSRASVLTESPAGIRLEDWDGIFLGGGAWCVTDPDKSAEQYAGENGLSELLGRVLAADFPFLGACYGIGALSVAIGATMGRRHPEPVGPTTLWLTPDADHDPVFAGVPQTFQAYGGHKESMSTVPQEVRVLATSPTCPVQAFRVGKNVYATQFHPELDLAGLETRIEVYSSYGYFEPSEADELKRRAGSVQVSEPMRLLANFVARHG